MELRGEDVQAGADGEEAEGVPRAGAGPAEGSVGEPIASLAWRPDFDPEDPHKRGWVW